MKIKKAFKKLTKIETALSAMLDQYSEGDQNLRDLLNSAKASVCEAKVVIEGQAAPSANKKPPAKAVEAGKGRLSASGRRNISRVAKKRWATAKRKGVNLVTGRPLKQTA